MDLVVTLELFLMNIVLCGNYFFCIFNAKQLMQQLTNLLSTMIRRLLVEIVVEDVGQKLTHVLDQYLCLGVTLFTERMLKKPQAPATTLSLFSQAVSTVIM